MWKNEEHSIISESDHVLLTGFKYQNNKRLQRIETATYATLPCMSVTVHAESSLFHSLSPKVSQIGLAGFDA